MRFLWLVIFLVLSAAPAFAEELTGEVIAVQDGDTVTLLSDANHLTKIRLAEIDAPELKQPYGKTSKRMLSDLVYKKEVTVITKTIDKFGRTVGRIYKGDTDVNLTMVKQGGAWAYRKYLTDKTILAAEDHAKAAAAGIWGLQKDQRMPPWEWRHGGKKAPQTEELQEGDGELEETDLPETINIPSSVQRHNTTNTSPAAPTCGKKTTCSQMANCTEAKFYLNNCGLSRLDRDNDGTPCETLCR